MIKGIRGRSISNTSLVNESFKFGKIDEFIYVLIVENRSRNT